jgi:hypothetical protein
MGPSTALLAVLWKYLSTDQVPVHEEIPMSRRRTYQADPLAYFPFVGNINIAQWSTIGGYPDTATPPPTGAPIRTILGATRLPRSSEAYAQGTNNVRTCDLVIGFPPRPPGQATVFFSTFDVEGNAGQVPLEFTLFEVPAGANQWWICKRSIVVGRGYVNMHKLCYCVKAYTAFSVEKF